MDTTIPPKGHRRTGGWRMAMYGGAVALLALPWVAMRFTDEVDWTAFDFLVFGLLLACACGAAELAVRRFHGGMARAVALAAVGATFILVWAVLAVG